MPDDHDNDGLDPLRHLRILTMKQVSELTTYVPAHIYRLERAGKFPKRRRIGPNRVGYPLKEVEKWFAARPVVELSDDDDHLHS